MSRRWRAAMAGALYGPDGFFVRATSSPADHFRTSVLASPLFAGALLRLLERIDRALDRPDPLDLVDVGAGRGELLEAVLAAAPRTLAPRLRPIAVEVGPDPGGPVSWRSHLPAAVTGLLVAAEWLDNVPVEVVTVDPAGVVRYLLVDPVTGEESTGDPVSAADAAWLARWWPLSAPGSRAEVGRPRDEAWAAAVGTVRRGAALAVDYGHLADARPPWGTLTGYRSGREVVPVPDGSCDLTAHVAVDATYHAAASALLTDTHGGCGSGGRAPGGGWCRQRDALRALGVDGARPPLELARTDPAGYLRALTRAGAGAELTDPVGLGGHYWLFHPVGLPDVDHGLGDLESRRS